MCDFRRLTTNDLSMVLQMNRDFRAGFIDAENAQRFLSAPQNWLFAAVKDNTVIGFAYGYALQRLDRAQCMLYIHEVGVTEVCQRQGGALP